jgi:hypothetical protein
VRHSRAGEAACMDHLSQKWRCWGLCNAPCMACRRGPAARSSPQQSERRPRAAAMMRCMRMPRRLWLTASACGSLLESCLHAVAGRV